MTTKSEDEINELSTLLKAVDYDVETSITELMERACNMMKQNLKTQSKKSGKGQWTWSVFGTKNITIEQKAIGGIFAAMRKTAPTKREAKTGMIGKILSPDEKNILYEPETENLSDKDFYRILNNTKSALAARLERNGDIVGVVNIESDARDDFDPDKIKYIIEYTSNIISQILFIDDYRNIL